MKDEDRKLLTEKLLGECFNSNVDFWRTTPLCSECGRFHGNRTFTTPDDMMAVFRKLMKKGDFASFMVFVYWDSEGDCDEEDMEHQKAHPESVFYESQFVGWLFSDPARFCELALRFGKEVLGWKA